jgi:hypothetical protein
VPPVLLAALVALQLGWQQLGPAGDAWLPAAAVLVGWTAAVAAVLHASEWRAGPLGAVLGAPLLVLALSAGWLTPSGAVLWAPVTTVFAVGLAMVADPRPSVVPDREDR